MNNHELNLNLFTWINKQNDSKITRLSSSALPWWKYCRIPLTMFTMLFPMAVQNIISTYQILGFIPLDKALHFLIGLIITIIMRWRKVRFRYVFLVIVSLEVFKEIHDSYVLGSTWLEHELDFIATLAYPSLLLITVWIKKKSLQSKWGALPMIGKSLQHFSISNSS